MPANQLHLGGRSALKGQIIFCSENVTLDVNVVYKL